MAQDEANTAMEEAAPARTSMVPTMSNTRLHVIIVGLWLCLFISALDGTIITTGLIKISSSFNALDQATWIVTTYLLTYNSFLMITSKLTDVWGTKTILLACNVLFIAFSMACGGAQSMVQLLVFRAIQGIGGSGMYSLTFVSVMKLIVPEKMGFYSGVISSVFAIANLLGPVLGGVITNRTTWRWIFWMNGPIVATSMVLLFFAMPGLKDGKSNRDRIRGFDSIGGILSVCWPIPLLFALQEAGAQYPWSSGVIIGTLVTGLVLFLAFGFYEAWVSYRTSKAPIFPMHFLSNPAMALLLLSMFLLGMPFYVAVIQLPQRFQAVNFTSAERAGVLLLPLTLMSPIGAMAAGLVVKKISAEWVLMAATALTSIGIGLLSSLPVGSHFSKATYGYEIIVGLGLGVATPPYFMMLYTSIQEKDVAIATGALNMMRTLGGCVAVAICTALHHSALQERLPSFLSSEQIVAVEESSAFIAQLPQEIQHELGRAFGSSYNRQFQVMLAFACLNFLVAISLGIVRKKKGIFGVIPVRKLENEFLKAAEKGDGARGEKKETRVNEVPTIEESPKSQGDAITNLGARPGEDGKITKKDTKEV